MDQLKLEVTEEELLGEARLAPLLLACGLRDPAGFPFINVPILAADGDLPVLTLPGSLNGEGTMASHRDP